VRAAPPVALSRLKTKEKQALSPPEREFGGVFVWLLLRFSLCAAGGCGGWRRSDGVRRCAGRQPWHPAGACRCGLKTKEVAGIFAPNRALCAQ
jgi:hypothetical protein